jgi:hypothetical protein
MITREQFERLPKYAQKQIEQLRRTIGHLKEEIQQLSCEETADLRVGWHDDLSLDTPAVHFKDRPAFFQLGTGPGGYPDEIQVSVKEDERGLYLLVMAVRGRILVEPDSSNVVKLRMP